MDFIIYSSLSSPRLEYIAAFIFKKLLGRIFRITYEIDDYCAFEGVKINYSNIKTDQKEIWIQPHTLLFEKNIKEQIIDISKNNFTPTFFNSTDSSSFPFDLLASAFYLLSRYEEYLPFTADAHSRFCASESLAYKADFLERPIIHEWLGLLITDIQKIHSDFQPKASQYHFHPTYDVDIPWAFKHRGWRAWARGGLELIKGNWSLLNARWKTLIDQNNDPFFCFGLLEKKHKKYGIRPQVFWLLANKHKHDINPDFRIKYFQQLIQHTAKWSDAGIHPSYQSNEKPALIKIEKQRLTSILKQTITSSRQHFLKLHLPFTYRQLIDAGITDDFSMGYADKIGYRAATSASFFWYDLEKEKTTSLRIHPFVAMDVTLKQYEAYTPEKAGEKLLELQDYCKKNELDFRILWHNSSFSEQHGWDGWPKIYWKLFE